MVSWLKCAENWAPIKGSKTNATFDKLSLLAYNGNNDVNGIIYKFKEIIYESNGIAYESVLRKKTQHYLNFRLTPYWRLYKYSKISNGCTLFYVSEYYIKRILHYHRMPILYFKCSTCYKTCAHPLQSYAFIIFK